MGQLIGPLPGGQGRVFSSPVQDLAARGYTVAEFLLDGTALSPQPAGGVVPGLDGHWDVEWAEPAAYRTRLYVVRPVDPAVFSGVVVVNWQNVTAGVDLGMPPAEIYRAGHAWVGVTAQRVAITGQAARPGYPATSGLPAWDPDRYGSLHHPGDAWSYDIFTAAVRLFAPGQGPVGPLGGLTPRILIASGASQSAMRLGSYLNMAQPRERLVDGFLLTVHWGICPRPPDQTLAESMVPLGDGTCAGTSRIRDDNGVPVLVLCSESEARHNLPARQPASDTYRFWEMAGTAHVAGDLQALPLGAGLGSRPTPPPDLTPNRVGWSFMVGAALRHLVAWVGDRVPPPTFAPIDIAAGEPARIRRDEWGNATGGVRLPEIEAATACHRGSNRGHPAGPLLGETVPFTREQLLTRYPGRAEYLSTWDGAVDALVAAGLDLEPDLAGLHARGRRHADEIFD